MAYVADAPFPRFSGRDGSPLDNGYLWFGEAGRNPKQYPVSTYWDDALTLPAVQPIRTIAGYPSRLGAASRVYTQEPYSVTVEDSRGVLVFTGSNVVPENTHFLSTDDFFVAVAAGYTANDGDIVSIGGPGLDVVRFLVRDPAATVMTGYAPARWRPAGPVFPEHFGACGPSDDAAIAIRTADAFCATYGLSLNFYFGKEYIYRSGVTFLGASGGELCGVPKYPGVPWAGNFSRHTRAAGAAVFHMLSRAADGDKWVLENIYFDGNRQNQTDQFAVQHIVALECGSTSGTGGDEPNSSNVTVRGCSFKNYSYAGHALHIKGFRGYDVSDNFFEDGGGDLYHCIYTRRCQWGTVDRNRFGLLVLGNAIKVQGSANSQDLVTVTNNIGVNCRRFINLTDHSYFNVSNNLCERLPGVSDTDGQGIVINRAENSLPGLNSVVSGNVMDGFSQCAFQLQDQRNVSVYGNTWANSPLLAWYKDLQSCNIYGNTYRYDRLTNLVGDGSGGFLLPGAIALRAVLFEQASTAPTRMAFEDKIFVKSGGLGELSSVGITTACASGSVEVIGDWETYLSPFATKVSETSATVLLFDFYKGTFSVAFSPATGAFTTQTADSGLCDYVWDRRQKWLRGTVSYGTDAITVGTASGNLYLTVTGLPYVPKARGIKGGSAWPVNVQDNTGTNPTWAAAVFPPVLAVMADVDLPALYRFTLYKEGATHGAQRVNSVVTDLATTANRNRVAFSFEFETA